MATVASSVIPNNDEVHPENAVYINLDNREDARLISNSTPTKPAFPSDLYQRIRSISKPKLTLAIVTVFAAIVGLFLFYYGQSAEGPTYQHNPILLISIDGFRPDYFKFGLTPWLSQIASEGVLADYMQPSFPTVTFPNHFTLVTGLYPESHGIVDNTFFDPILNKTFVYYNSSTTSDPNFWNAEPVWNTVIKNNMKSAVYMWPGCDVHIGGISPTYMVPYNKSVTHDDRVAQVMEWLDLPPESRPDLIAMYVPSIDQAGHTYGPTSSKVKKALSDVDDMFGNLYLELQKRNILDNINIVVVSDHGMTATSRNNLVYVENLVNPNSVIEVSLGSPAGLIPVDPNNLQTIFNEVQQGETLVGNNGSEITIFSPYLRENIPTRLHYSDNIRIPPILIIPNEGWMIINRAWFDTNKTQGDFIPRGAHGFDNNLESMRAIFLARGPNFVPGSAITNSEDGSSYIFQNVEVYNMLCQTLGIPPNPNNGTTEGIEMWTSVMTFLP